MLKRCICERVGDTDARAANHFFDRHKSTPAETASSRPCEAPAKESTETLFGIGGFPVPTNLRDTGD